MNHETEAPDKQGHLTTAESAEHIALHRVRNPKRIVAFVVAMTFVLAGAFAAGAFVRSPTDDALEVAKTVVPVIVSVENRVVSDAFAIPASLTPGKSFDVVIAEPSVEAAASAASAAADTPGDRDAQKPDASDPQPGSDRIVVTATGAAPGEAIGYGRLLGEVSGRPVFTIPASVPLYRDLLPAAQGNDVAALQRTLIELGYYGVRNTGVFDSGTLDAIRRLYKKAGYSLPYIAPGIQGVAWREFTSLPTADATISSVAAVGTTLTADVPLARLQVSSAVLSARVTATDKDSLPVGAEVGVSVNGGETVKTSVLAVGGFTTDEDSGASWYPVTVAIPDGTALEADSTLQLTPLDEPAPGPAIPVVALRQQADGVYVTLHEDAKPGDGPRPTPTARPIKVEVLAQQDGWAAIKTNSKLPVGTRLVVEP